MALNFPDSPSNGDTFQGFIYNSSKGVWNSAGVADTAVTAYANLAAFPSSGNTVGDYAFATNTKALYVWDGAEWDRISTGNNETPRLTTTPASTHNLSGSGSTTQITIAASDPEGFPITYSYDTNPVSPNQLTNVSESNGVFTLTPSTNSAHAGSFTLRLKASDGVSTISHPITVSLAFQTTFTFDTSSSVINTNYTADNKLEAYVQNSDSPAVSSQSGRLGKGYLEVKFISTTAAADPMFGLQVGTSTGKYHQGGAWVHVVNGKGWPSNDYAYGLGGSGSNSIGINDILMIAYDTAAGSNGQVWFGKNGTWQRNPASTTGYGVNADSSSVGFRVAVDGTNASKQTHQIEIISHTQGAQYTIPSGWELA